MQIELKQLGKRYRYEWIFSQLDYVFETGKHYAITGPNGSGKSTLLRILSGHLSPTKGSIEHSSAGKKIPTDEVYSTITYAAPYIELIKEFTLLKLLSFHRRFKPFLPDLSLDDLIGWLDLEKSLNKEIRYFSSGMKQRVKLLLAICSDTTLILLDEPGTNLDHQGMLWYHQLIQQFALQRTLIVASNVEEDFKYCTHRFSILDYKRKKQ